MNASISVLVASLTTREASIDPGLGFPGLVVNEATVTSILESIPVTKASPMQCAGTALCTAWHMIARSTYTHTHIYIYIYIYIYISLIYMVPSTALQISTPAVPMQGWL